MRASASEYLSIVARTWWARVTLLAGAVGLASELTNLVVPSVVWWVIVGVAVVLAQFSAFDHVRRDRETLASQLRSEEVPPEEPTFTPNLFEGRIFPTSDYFVIESAERAFVIRAAFAFVLGDDHELLGTDLQKRFEDAVASSAFEGWFQAQTNVFRLVPPDQWWKRVQPTGSKIVTVARAATKTAYDDFTVAGHCVLNLKPGLQPWHPGYGVLLASAIFRSNAGQSDFTGQPMSFDGLYETITIFEAALVDQIAPAIVPDIGNGTVEPCALALLATANGGSVEEYVALHHHHWPRAEGSWEPNALFGQAANEHTVTDPDERDAEVRGWLVRFLADAGFSELEADVARLQRPRLPVPVPS